MVDPKNIVAGQENVWLYGQFCMVDFKNVEVVHNTLRFSFIFVVGYEIVGLESIFMIGFQI